MAITTLPRSGIHPWDRFKSWVTSASNVPNVPPDLAAAARTPKALPAPSMGARGLEPRPAEGGPGTSDQDHSPT